MKFFKKMIENQMNDSSVLKSLLKSVKTIVESVHVLFNRQEETNKKIFKLEEDFEKIMEILTSPIPHPHDELDLFEDEKHPIDESEEDKKKRLN